MPWSTRVDPDFPIVVTRYEGVLEPSELSEAIRESLVVARDCGRNLFLGDCSALAGGHSVVDLYALADALLASGVVRGFREAVLLPALPDSAENVRFWETTCLNRGIRVRIFLDRESALAWLLS